MNTLQWVLGNTKNFQPVAQICAHGRDGSLIWMTPIKLDVIPKLEMSQTDPGKSFIRFEIRIEEKLEAVICLTSQSQWDKVMQEIAAIKSRVNRYNTVLEKLQQREIERKLSQVK